MSNYRLNLSNSSQNIRNTDIDLSKTNSLKQFCDSTDLNFNINEAHVVLKDIAPFAPILRNFSTPINLTCNIGGTINNLRLEHMNLSYGEKSILLKSKGSLDGIISPRNAFIFGEIQELNASSKGIQSLINDFSSIRKDANPILSHLGTVNFHGEISGFITQLITFGEFNSNIGKLRADIMISRNTK